MQSTSIPVYELFCLLNILVKWYQDPRKSTILLVLNQVLPSDRRLISSVILASSNSSSCVNLLTSATFFFLAISFIICFLASTSFLFISASLVLSDVVFLSVFFSEKKA